MSRPSRSTPDAPRFSRRAAIATSAAGLSALVLAACSPQEEALAEQANAGGDTGYIAGDGSVTEYSEAERSEPVSFSGTLFDGTTVDAEGLRGKPALLNFWYAGCAPCRKEAPDLVEMAHEHDGDIAFYGVNVRDERATAEAFERTFEIPYPSFEDRDGGVLLALSEFVPPQAVPTTIILDAEGRVASRVLGIAEPSILKALLDDVVDA
ncbi:TlpA family protein disulfide reductase [Kocuria coralli]|uniref:TlpA family protein disulfide reductase n=1 Tax=Kocuria coralli TaxID=1461025 RepID=A0A5J5L0B7_9MICC|nr:TlpA disulfide reductase family protein [Kocuria coralli]KAA9395292.1 TlpA family protein disulfide reductase [Kocuria coralli]